MAVIPPPVFDFICPLIQCMIKSRKKLIQTGIRRVSDIAKTIYQSLTVYATPTVESSYCLPLWDMVGMAKENADSERSSVGSAGKVNVRMGDFTHRESRSNETQSTSQDQPYMTISDLSREKTALLPRSGSGCTYTFSFDAENRLIQITYPGTNNYSTFVYDGLGRNVSIVETSAGSVTSTKHFVWCGNDRCEQRNSSTTITAQFFRQGETISGTSY